jgi:hypothetical protein
VEAVQQVYEEHKEQSQVKTRGIKRLENQGIPEEELRMHQQELFQKAQINFRLSQQSLDTSSLAPLPDVDPDSDQS